MPTLALLFGLPIPKNNLGVIVPELFNNTGDPGEILDLFCLFSYFTEYYLRALQINSDQQLNVMKQNSIFWAGDKPANSRISELVAK